MPRIHAASPRLLTVALLLLLLAAAGCGEPVSSGSGFSITNEVSLFRFQVKDLKNYSQTYSFTWTNLSNTGTVVDQFSSVTGGDATFVLKDASGTTVYARSLKENGKFATDPGAPGDWTVQILLNKTSGSLLFQAAPN